MTESLIPAVFFFSLSWHFPVDGQIKKPNSRASRPFNSLFLSAKAVTAIINLPLSALTLDVNHYNPDISGRGDRLMISTNHNFTRERPKKPCQVERSPDGLH